MGRLISVTVVAIVSLLVSSVPVSARAQTDQELPCIVAGSLCDLLSLVPDILIDHPDVNVVFSYANAAAQLEAFGMERPTTDEGEEFTRWSLAMTSVPIGGAFLPYLRFWPEEMGFSYFDLDQSLEVGDPPDRILLLRGRFDGQRVIETWTRLGYQEMSVGGQTIWKLRDDYEIDIRGGSATTQLNGRNYAAFVRPDVIVFTSNLAAISSVVGTTGSLLRPLSQRPELADLVDTVGPDVVTAWAGTGASIGSTGELFLLALTSGGPMPAERRDGTPWDWADSDDMRARFAIKYPAGTDVEAVATEVAGKLETLSSTFSQVPFREIFAERNVSADPGRSTVLLDLLSSEDFRPGIALEMIFRLDLDFLV